MEGVGWVKLRYKQSQNEKGESSGSDNSPNYTTNNPKFYPKQIFFGCKVILNVIHPFINSSNSYFNLLQSIGKLGYVVHETLFALKGLT